MRLKIAGAIAALMLAFAAGWQVQAWRYEAKIDRMVAGHSQALQQAEAAARATEHRLRDAAAEIDRLSEQGRDKIRVVTETVEKEVIRYVQKKSDRASCVLPADWVRIHNAATELPGNTSSTGTPDGPDRNAADAP